MIIKNKELNFIFKFAIGLHVDDTAVLHFIQKNLGGIGSVNTRGKVSSFIVTKKEELLIILDIFHKSPLNTTKHLNFLAFSEAYYLYYNKHKKSLELKASIDNIRGTMNNKRTNFSMVEFKQIRITPYWFLGFVEGEGSFSISKEGNYYKLIFSISQSAKDSVLMQELKNFINNLASNSNINDFVTVTSSKRYPDMPFSIIKLNIQNQNFIENVLIPFFDLMIFNSKKKLDFQDWKFILKLKQLGFNYTEKGIKVLDQILSQMNNHRLSTNSNTKIDRTLLINNIEQLLNEPSNLEIKANGKVWIKSLNKYKSGGSNNKNIKVHLQESNGLVINTFESISSCARFLEIVPSRAKALLDNNKSILFNNKYYFIKKVEDDSRE